MDETQKNTLIDGLRKHCVKYLSEVSKRDVPISADEAHNKLCDFFSPNGGSLGAENYSDLALCTSSAVATVLLLYRRGLLPDFERGPELFIRDLVAILVGASDDEIQDIFECLRYRNGEYVGLKSVNWSNLIIGLRDIVVVHWPALDVFCGLSGSDLHQNGSLPNVKFQIPQIGSCSYHDYLSFVNNQLQRHVGCPDLVIIDSVQVEDYRVKGSIETIDFYLDKKTRDGLEIVKDKEGKIGRTINGYTVALPLSRNFHLSARGVNYAPGLIEYVKNEEKTLNSNKRWVAMYGQRLSMINSFFDKNNVFDLEKFVEWDTTDQLNEFIFKWVFSYKNCFAFSENVSEECEDLQHPFLLNVGPGEPFIPMQLARGAHVVYTIFSYLSGLNIDNQSLLTIDNVNGDGLDNKQIKIKILKDELMVTRLKCFLKCVFLYTPVVALCLDHQSSAKLRNIYPTLWIDPCLPIEAAKFGDDETPGCNNKIAYSPRPARFGNSELSCLGGYCIAITGRSGNKHSAAVSAHGIAGIYRDLRRNTNDTVSTFSTAIPDSETKSTDIINFSTSNRPQLPNWPLIEEQISEIVRPYILTVMIYRAILIDAFKKEEHEITDVVAKSFYPTDFLAHLKASECGAGFGDELEGKIKSYLRSSLNAINKSFIAKFDLSKHEKDSIFNSFQLNIETFDSDLIKVRYILEEISHVKNKDRMTPDFAMQRIAERLSAAIETKLTSLCKGFGWGVSLKVV